MAVAAFSEISLTPIFDNNGALVRNARLYFYKPNTLDPYTVYQDQELGAPHPQPVVTGGSGRVPPIYVGPDPYRIRIFDNANQLIEDIPWLPGGTEDTDSGGGGGADTAMRTGDVIWSFSSGGVREGFVRLNGGTIGNSLSGATERANDDAHDLFVYLWGQDSGALMPILPGRGASAESDWLANKQLTLLDGAGHVLGGISTMGKPARDIFPGMAMTVGTRDQPGSRLGTAMHAVTVNQMPIHAHGVTDPGHAHGASQAVHNHSAWQDAHAHGVNDPTHAHSVYDPGHAHGVGDPGHAHSASQGQHRHNISNNVYNQGSVTNQAFVASAGAGLKIGTSYTDYEQPAITVNAAGTGIWIGASGTGIGIYGAGTGISIQNAQPAVYTGNAQPAVTVNAATTGVSVNNQGGGQEHPNTQPTILGTFYMKL